ncbi:hypothetical protein NDU88_001038 [Pleurodeles waltl]|uniref:Uncharacterized protein n=1 Tax=Pleurodeles waltl TaxID=8319 RepID=A0AAV7V8I3_PLEWA|nr:hypothetical protein NDU88_001038 [Pleurodeles waltl]
MTASHVSSSVLKCISSASVPREMSSVLRALVPEPRTGSCSEDQLWLYVHTRHQLTKKDGFWRPRPIGGKNQLNAAQHGC